MPRALRRATIGRIVVLGRPRLMINDPLERRRAEQAMVEGGHTFHLDPPKDVQVSVDDRGAVEWVLS